MTLSKSYDPRQYWENRLSGLMGDTTRQFGLREPDVFLRDESTNIDKPRLSRAVFIVSTGRTGTEFLAQFFRTLGAEAFHEPGPRWLRIASNAYVSENLSHQLAKRILRVTRSIPLLDKNKRYVETSCLIYGLVAPLLELSNDFEVVQVVRDPRTFVRSAMNWGMYGFGGRPLNLVPFRRLAEPHFNPWSVKTRIEWAKRDQFKRLCWAWTAMNHAIREQGKDSSRFRSVRFEDLFDARRGYPGLMELCNLTGWKPSAEQVRVLALHPVNPSLRKKFPNWKDWTPRHREYLASICGDEAKHYGYNI